MSPLFYAAVILLVGGGHLCSCSKDMRRASNVFWWIGLILAVFGLILFAVAVIMAVAGPVQGIIGSHGSP